MVVPFGPGFGRLVAHFVVRLSACSSWSKQTKDIWAPVLLAPTTSRGRMAARPNPHAVSARSRSPKNIGGTGYVASPP
jgi:hypothetical protein